MQNIAVFKQSTWDSGRGEWCYKLGWQTASSGNYWMAIGRPAPCLRCRLFSFQMNYKVNSYTLLRLKSVSSWYMQDFDLCLQYLLKCTNNVLPFINQLAPLKRLYYCIAHWFCLQLRCTSLRWTISLSFCSFSYSGVC